MIAICSRVKHHIHGIILHTYSREPDEIVSALERWSVIKETAHPAREVYLEVDGFEIPADLCRKALAAIEQESSAGVLTAAIDKILSYPKQTMWSGGA